MILIGRCHTRTDKLSEV